MNIAIIGYGKMGKTIESIAVDRGHTIGMKIHSKNIDELTAQNLSQIDVAIEFSNPANAMNNIKTCLSSSTPTIIGTTGWYQDYNKVVALCNENKTSMLAATNFSVGVNLFFDLNKKLAQLMSSRNEYTAELEEIHHTEKLDSPSGTAITLAEGIIEKHSSYNEWRNNEMEKTNKDFLNINSIREENVPGTHEVNYESKIDSISIKHIAKNRNGFALGAVLAAEYIYNKKGIFSMRDVLKLN